MRIIRYILQRTCLAVVFGVLAGILVNIIHRLSPGLGLEFLIPAYRFASRWAFLESHSSDALLYSVVGVFAGLASLLAMFLVDALRYARSREVGQS
jgi:hypothetical protein